MTVVCYRWAIFFSHPKDYTPVCTTELGRVLQLQSEFAKRGVKQIALSCDSVEDHVGWCKVNSKYTHTSSYFLWRIMLAGVR